MKFKSVLAVAALAAASLSVPVSSGVASATATAAPAPCTIVWTEHWENPTPEGNSPADILAPRGGPKTETREIVGYMDPVDDSNYCVFGDKGGIVTSVLCGRTQPMILGPDWATAEAKCS
ncbi:hypothetical protein OG897_03920 [Streptomyces sp. NBC_00237]|uniref:hypothetical protein n=1 Tax=Streptomyces sp. NBC_00237 TaxID=2975687 RepID=UPI00225A48AB|nr:hypothetical protein [Streptomyces sp. NBC_00237]MCX5200613.1 hypothetical protein [Streptomyces sp. NBC_00237]